MLGKSEPQIGCSRDRDPFRCADVRLLFPFGFAPRALEFAPCGALFLGARAKVRHANRTYRTFTSTSAHEPLLRDMHARSYWQSQTQRDC